MKLWSASVVMAFALSSVSAIAAVSPEEAKRLSGDLTPVGAERQGNAEGTIPAWTGGMTTAPDGHVQGQAHVDPFANEKPLFSININNLEEHQHKMSAGQIALMKRYPDTFRMDIYPTHRTSAAPQYVYDNTALNATRATLTHNGNQVSGAYAGFPFPIPQNGSETIWNHLLRWVGEGVFKSYWNYTVFPSGERRLGGGELWETYPYYDKDGSLETFNGGILHVFLEYTAPVRRKGEIILLRDSVNAVDSPRQAWQYNPGQRRVRRAPIVAYDTPNPMFSGQQTYDDAFMFNGATDRYDWNLVGKKEIYIPYNNNGLVKKGLEGLEAQAEMLTPSHPDMDYVRWELHRVWVVEATLKDHQRHVYARRTFYLDEDSWNAVTTDIYDGRGTLWRVGVASLLNAYDVPLTATRAYWHADLQNGAYTINEIDNKPLRFYEGESDDFFTPAQIRQKSRR